MPSPKYLRAQARRYLDVAAEETDGETARVLGLLAAECLTLADAIEQEAANAPGPPAAPARASRREKRRTGGLSC